MNDEIKELREEIQKLRERVAILELQSHMRQPINSPYPNPNPYHPNVAPYQYQSPPNYTVTCKSPDPQNYE